MEVAITGRRLSAQLDGGAQLDGYTLYFYSREVQKSIWGIHG